jgi:hypothetical protein
MRPLLLSEHEVLFEPEVFEVLEGQLGPSIDVA